MPKRKRKKEDGTKDDVKFKGVTKNQGVVTPYVLRKGGYFVKKFDSSYNNFFSVWEH